MLTSPIAAPAATIVTTPNRYVIAITTTACTFLMISSVRYTSLRPHAVMTCRFSVWNGQKKNVMQQSRTKITLGSHSSGRRIRMISCAKTNRNASAGVTMNIVFFRARRVSSFIFGRSSWISENAGSMTPPMVELMTSIPNLGYILPRS